MTTKLSSIGMVLVCTVLISIAQILYKKSIAQLSIGVAALLTSPFLWAGLALYGLGAVILIIALRGGDLSALYPIIATGYIWVSILSVYFFGETMNLLKWSGVAGIVLGITFFGIGSRKQVDIFQEVKGI